MNKYIKKSNLFRHLFIMDDGTLVSVRLKSKRVRKKFISRYVESKLKEDI